jgi:hypothetical protein
MTPPVRASLLVLWFVLLIRMALRLPPAFGHAIIEGAPALILAIPLCIVAIRFLRNVRLGYSEGLRDYRLAHRQCLTCGYSLRGNVSGVCPECGARAIAESLT